MGGNQKINCQRPKKFEKTKPKNSKSKKTPFQEKKNNNKTNFNTENSTMINLSQKPDD